MLKIDYLRATLLLSKYPVTAFCLHAYIKTMLSDVSIDRTTSTLGCVVQHMYCRTTITVCMSTFISSRMSV